MSELPKFIAVDFDKTLINFHCSDGTTLDELLLNKKEIICDFVKHCIDSGRIVGIATYNTNVDLISQFCEKVFSKKLPIQYGLPNNLMSGKEEHIKKLFPDEDPKNIMLVDDNINNICIAKKSGHGIHFVDNSF